MLRPVYTLALEERHDCDAADRGPKIFSREGLGRSSRCASNNCTGKEKDNKDETPRREKLDDGR